MKQKFFIIGLVVLCACHPTPKQVVSATAQVITIDSTYYSDSAAYTQHLLPIKNDLDKQMSAVIGQCAHTLTVAQPESTLSNWASDVMLQAGTQVAGKPIDIAVVNVGGLRCDLPEGELQLHHVYELMPFDNELVLITLRGNEVDSLCQNFAQVGGQGVAGLRFGIKAGRAVNITVGGQPLNAAADYLISTSDYLSEGNDRMEPLSRGTVKATGVVIRNIFLEAIKTQSADNGAVDAQLDGRIYFL